MRAQLQMVANALGPGKVCTDILVRLKLQNTP